MRRKARRKRED